MSGIFGLFLKDSLEIHPGVARTASRLLSPCDDEETCHWQTQSCLLGVTRSRGMNPCTSNLLSKNESGRIHAVCEGTILNSHELSHALERAGHVVSGGGGAEILAHLGEGKQVDWELGLRGSFAFAIWDGYDHTLRLSVDRFGAKSLYWIGDEYWIAFASSLPALRGLMLEWGREAPGKVESPSLQARFEESGWRMDLQAVEGYLFSGCVRAPRSICQLVNSLPPAGRLTWRAGSEPSVEIWWTPRDHPKRMFSLRKAIPEFLQVFHETIPLYLDKGSSNLISLSADPASLFLSQETSLQEGIQCMACAFTGEEHGSREIQILHEMAASLPFEFREYPIPAPCDGDLPALVHPMSEPMGHPSVWNTFSTIKQAGSSQGSWVSNLGSDQVWEVTRPQETTLPVGFWEGLLATDTGVNMSLPRPEGNRTEDLDQLRLPKIGSILPYHQLRTLHALAAAHSLEVRLPWLDPVLFEWLAHLPRTLKTSGRISHWLLRKALQAGAYPIPQPLLTQKAISSEPPVDRWLSRNLASLFQETVLSSSAAVGPLFRTPRLRQAFEVNRADLVKLGQPLWTILILEIWLRENRLAL